MLEIGFSMAVVPVSSSPSAFEKGSLVCEKTTCSQAVLASIPQDSLGLPRDHLRYKSHLTCHFDGLSEP